MEKVRCFGVIWNRFSKIWLADQRKEEEKEARLLQIQYCDRVMHENKVKSQSNIHILEKS